MREMLSTGSPMEVSTKVMVTMPPCGIPAPPVAAAVAVRLEIHSFKPLMTLEMLELCKEGFVFKDLNEVMVLKRSYVQKQRELQCNQHLFSNLAVKHHSIHLTTDE